MKSEEKERNGKKKRLKGRKNRCGGQKGEMGSKKRRFCREEAFQIAHGKALKIHGTICSPVKFYLLL